MQNLEMEESWKAQLKLGKYIALNDFPKVDSKIDLHIGRVRD